MIRFLQLASLRLLSYLKKKIVAFVVQVQKSGCCRVLEVFMFLSASQHCYTVGCSAVWLVTLRRDQLVITSWQKFLSARKVHHTASAEQKNSGA